MDLEEPSSVLTTTFPGAEVTEIEHLPGGRIVATLAAPQFDGQDMIDRQNAVWDALKRRFSRDELRGIGMILAFTPFELAAMAKD